MFFKYPKKALPSCFFQTGVSGDPCRTTLMGYCDITPPDLLHVFYDGILKQIASTTFQKVVCSDKARAEIDARFKDMPAFYGNKACLRKFTNITSMKGCTNMDYSIIVRLLPVVIGFDTEVIFDRETQNGIQDTIREVIALEVVLCF